MGILKLTKKHRKLAKRFSWNDPDLRDGTRVSADALYDTMSGFLERKGVKIVVGRRENMLVSMPRRLYVPAGWASHSTAAKARDLSHEAVHYRQRDTFRHGSFEARYVTSARFRVAVEIPAYAEGMAAMFCTGYTDAAIERYIQDVPGMLRRGYMLGALDWSNTKLFILDELRRRHQLLQRSRRG